MISFAGKFAGRPGERRREQLGRAKVQQPGSAVFGHQDVIRLQVAVDNEMLVGKLDGLANAHEQRDPLGHGKTPIFTEAMDGNSIHVLHHQKQVAVGGDAAIQQAGNIRMLELGQNLPFLAEPFPKQIGRQGQVDEFDGDLLLELPVGTMRQLDGAHPATS